MLSNKETPETIKTKVAQYLRYIKQCPVVSFESSIYGHNGVSDVLAITSKRQLIDVEVKMTLSDLRADVKKTKHMLFYNDYFGYGIAESFIDNRKDWKREWELMKIYENYGGEVPVNHVNLFYFATIPRLVNPAKFVLDKFYPYAGLMIVKPERNYYGHYIVIERKAKPFIVPRVGLKQIIALVKGMSATLVRVSAKAEGVKLL